MERDAKSLEKKGVVDSLASFKKILSDEAAYGEMILAYCKKYPEGDVKKGKKRGTLDWVQVQKRLSMITYTDIGIKVKLMDRLEYSTKMKSKWEWTKETAWKEWDKMVANPVKFKQLQEVGPSGKLELHIWVPLGKSARVGSKAEEIHEIIFGSKPKKGGVTEDDMSITLDELSSGHSMHSSGIYKNVNVTGVVDEGVEYYAPAPEWANFNVSSVVKPQQQELGQQKNQQKQQTQGEAS